MKKFGKIFLTLIAISALTFSLPLEAKKCKKKKHCCYKIILGAQGVPGAQGPQGDPGTAFNNYLFAYKTSLQTAAGAGTFFDIIFDFVPTISNWTQVDTSTFRATTSGIYAISISSTLTRADTTVNVATLRITRNNTEIPGSQIAGIFPATILNSLDLAKTILVQVNAGEEIRVQFASLNGNPIFLSPIGDGTQTSASIAINRIN